jgi:hypothetical protein
MRIFVSVVYLLPFIIWSFLGIQTNFSSGPFQVISTKIIAHIERIARKLD